MAQPAVSRPHVSFSGIGWMIGRWRCGPPGVAPTCVGELAAFGLRGRRPLGTAGNPLFHWSGCAFLSFVPHGPIKTPATYCDRGTCHGPVNR